MGWLLAIVLGVLLYRARRELKTRRSQFETAQTGRVWTAGFVGQAPAPPAAQPLITLRLQFRHMREDGALKEDEYRQLTDKIDACWVSERETSDFATGGELWWATCQAGWNILTANGLSPHGPPPWRQTPTSIKAGAPATVTVANPAESRPHRQTAVPLSAEPHTRAERARAQSSSADPARGGASNEAQKPSLQPPANKPPSPPAVTASAAKHAWQPVEPGPLEQALRVVSGWPKMLVPFLIQNIGWFIGAFLFLAGTVFLVTYTTGYLKASVVFASLFAYAVFLTWSGYKLLRKRPRLETASTVLLFTGLLLVPLSISAATRLLMNAGGSPLLWSLGLAAAAACLGIVHAGTQLVAGVVHRALRGEYPRVFLALASIQLGAPLVALWPSWLALAVVHLAILGILAYGLVRLAHHWLSSVFVDNRKVLFFAAGALLFAALTSFVHLTWGAATVSLPRGYYAPYLILLCGLLFYLDAKFKVQSHRSAFLSRLSFCIYGLSVIAVLLAINAPVARLVTLTMATGLYALVVWKYLTLIPLYLMLANLAALFAFAVLAHFPAATHFLLATPGLVGLHMLSRWAGKNGMDRPPTQAHGLAQLGLVTYRVTLLLLTLLAIWSLVMGGPSVLATVSALSLAAGLWWLLRAGPGPILAFRTTGCRTAGSGIELTNHLERYWLYGPIAAVSLASFFTPPIAVLSWATQWSLGLTLTATLWAALLILGRRSGLRRSPSQTEMFANAALLSVFLGSALAVLPLPRFEINGFTLGTLGIGAGVMLVLSLNLYVRWLFYLFLTWGAATAATVKLTYFSGPSMGLSEILAAAAIWASLWWLDRRPDALSAMARTRAREGTPVRLLWLLPMARSAPDGPDTDGDRVRVPVRQKAVPRVSVEEPEPLVAALGEASTRV